MDHDHAYSNEILKRAIPLDGLDALLPLIEEIKDKKIVMLGESSHGTHEFYEWRRLISTELIKHHGFSFIAVEADWPPAEIVNEAIKVGNQLSPAEILKAFSRWPTWMWANSDIELLMKDLRE